MLERETARHRLAALTQAPDLTSDRERPVDQSPPRARRLVERADDRRVDLLVDTRHAREHGRSHRGERIRDRVRVGLEGDAVAVERPGQVHEAAEVVRQREVEQAHVTRLHVARHLLDHRSHLVVVPVADHAALRRAGRARGVDERVQVLLVDLVHRIVERARMLRRMSGSFRVERGSGRRT